MKIKIPHNYQPRDYQLPFLQAMDSGYKRAVLVWPRRSGKEKSVINFTAKSAVTRPGTYLYMFPEYTQARKVLWDGMDKDGFRFIDHFPKEIRTSTPNNTEMKIRVRSNGGESLVQLAGSDNIDSYMSSNPVGIVFAEYSLQDPRAWSFMRPILAENNGWAIFDFTPRGENHAFDIYKLAKADPANWFCSHLTVEDTKHISKEILEQEEREYVRLEGNNSTFRQEYYCDFSVPIAGAYYAEQINKANDEGRICNVPHDPRMPVTTIWDLGVNDRTSIWFVQMVGHDIRLIDYVENTGKGLPFYAELVKSKPYQYEEHIAPHDIKVREFSSGASRIETARGLGIDFRVAPNLSISDGIDAVRNIFGKCWFDAVKCKDGINALKNYHKRYDETRKTYLDEPYHDWSSNAADAFRMMAVGVDTTTSRLRGTDLYANTKPKRRAFIPKYYREAIRA